MVAPPGGGAFRKVATGITMGTCFGADRAHGRTKRHLPKRANRYDFENAHPTC